VLFAHLIRHLRGLAELVPENALSELIRFYNFCRHLSVVIPWSSGADASFASISFISHLTGLQRVSSYGFRNLISVRPDNLAEIPNYFFLPSFA